MRHVYIAGVDRREDLESNTLEIEEQLTYQMNTCSFVLKGDRPTEGEEVIIEDDNLGRMFAGTIVSVELNRYNQSKTMKTWSVECDDYTNKLDSKLVVETYEDMPADEIFKDLARKYCPDFTVNGVRSGAPTVEMIVFDYLPPSECFRELAEYCGWQWEPDYYMDLHFFDTDELTAPAPMEIVPGGKFRNVSFSIDNQGLRNRVYVRGGTMLSDPFTYEIEADGVARLWMLPHKPHELSFNQGSVGIEHLHDEEDYDYLMNFQEKYIRASAHTPTLPAGTNLSFTFKYDIPVDTIVDDLESQEKISAIQGGDGVYEHVIEDNSLVTLDAAEAAGLADLRQHANPNVKGSFETIVPGWRPGQILRINLPDRGIDGEYLVQTVRKNAIDGGRWIYTIDFGGRLLGIADVLKSLVSSQQKRRYNESVVLNKFQYGQERITMIDDIEATHRQTPFVCGDIDAICGFVGVAEYDEETRLKN